MSLRLSCWFKVCLALAVIGWGGLRPRTARAEDKPAAPSSSVTASKRPAPAPALVRSYPAHNALLRLEDELSRAFQFLKPDTSLDIAPPVPLPAPGPAPVLSKRAREKLQEQKDWVFAKPEDLTDTPTPEDMLNLPEYDSDGQRKKQPSSVERFYQDLEQRRTALAKRDPLAPKDTDQLSQDSALFRDRDPSAEPNLPSGVRSSGQRLRKLLQSAGSALAPNPDHASLLDLFGLGKTTSSSGEELAQKAYLNQFQSWLNRGAVAQGTPLANPLDNFQSPGSQVMSAASSLNALGPPSRPVNFDPTIGAANPALMVSSPQDVTTKVLNQWNPLYAPPQVEPPKMAPPEPVFDVPRRKF